MENTPSTPAKPFEHDPSKCYKCGSPNEPYGKGQVLSYGVCGFCADDMGDHGYDERDDDDFSADDF